MSTVYRLAALYPEGYGGATDYATLDEAKVAAERMVEHRFKVVHIKKISVELVVEYKPAPEIESDEEAAEHASRSTGEAYGRKFRSRTPRDLPAHKGADGGRWKTATLDQEADPGSDEQGRHDSE